MLRRFSIIVSFCAVAFCAAALQAGEVAIAQSGQARLEVIVAPGEPQAVKDAANELATALGRITGGTFTVREGREGAGLVVGTAEQWPQRLPEPVTEALFAREDYRLQTTEQAIFLIGRTPLGVSNAVWDFLHRLGFRHFFPGEMWEVWPSRPDLAVELDVFEHPAWVSRAFRFLPREGVDVETWAKRNRLRPGFQLRAQHMYEALIKRNRAHFEQHPQDLIPAAKDVKLDPSSPTLRALAVADSLRLLRRHSDWDSLSMEPSDGGNWREDSPLGSPSNQAVTLANHVAAAVREALPERQVKVGLLAYHLHSPPPTVSVDKDVIVRIATAFLEGGYTAEALLEGWRAQGAATGITEFMSIWSWNLGLPGNARAADIGYLAQSAARFHALGARHWNAQATGSWGPDGVGYYLMSRLLWSPDEGRHVPELLEDFYRSAFGRAAEPMRRFYEGGIFKSRSTLFSEPLVGDLYRNLQEAWAREEDATVRARLGELALYVRYLELLLAARGSTGSAQSEALEALAQLVADHRQSLVVNMTLPPRRSPVPGAPLPEVEAAAEPSPLEVRYRWVEEGAQRYPALPFTPVAFSGEALPVESGADAATERTAKVEIIGTNRLALHAGAAPATFHFTVRGALLYRTRGPVRLRLFAAANPNVADPVAEAELPADGVSREVALSSPYAGPHRLELADGSGGTELSWPEGQRVALPVAADEAVGFLSRFRHSLRFYVPRGTQVVGGYSARAVGQLRFPDGRVALDFASRKGPGYFSVPVPAEMAGRSWAFHEADGGTRLLTVPPWLAREAGELLIPQDAETKEAQP